MPLQQNIFAAGNFTMAKAGNLFGLNGTFGDLDMLPMSASWWADGPDSEKFDLGQTIASLYMMARAPLMHAGRLPADPTTLGFLTNEKALDLHANATRVRVGAYEGNCSCVLDHHHYNPSLIVPGTCTIPAGSGGPPCVATWSAELRGERVGMKINMGENATTVAGLAGATDVWTGRALGATEELRPHASLLFSLGAEAGRA